uniref:Uncharacterized protein n=1 Tax=Amphimedon queenslandica TaxID=400682 RepID=A0A1X7UCJ7_AMPQE
YQNKVLYSIMRYADLLMVPHTFP